MTPSDEAAAILYALSAIMGAMIGVALHLYMTRLEARIRDLQAENEELRGER